jgi:hypothetical protein
MAPVIAKIQMSRQEWLIWLWKVLPVRLSEDA